MGGAGSGYWYRWNTKETTDSMYRVDLRYMRKNGLLVAGYSGTLSWSRDGIKNGSIGFRIWEDHLMLNYRNRFNGGPWEDIEDTIYLTWTNCNYGGRRPWMVCPSCNRRVLILYGGKYFRCRHCHNLSYNSQNERPMFRQLSKAQKIRERLGGSSLMSERFPEKPKGMHWKTYWKRKREAEKAHDRSWEICDELYGAI